MEKFWSSGRGRILELKQCISAVFFEPRLPLVNEFLANFGSESGAIPKFLAGQLLEHLDAVKADVGVDALVILRKNDVQQ